MARLPVAHALLMAIIATFVLNAALNFALGLVVALGLGPEDFGRYAVAASVAVVLNSALFDWLRLAAVRFYSDRTRQEDAGLRATLELGYAAISGGLALCLVLAVLAGVDLGMPAMMAAAAAATGVCMGLFDYQTSLARARFQERTYALLVLVKNGAAFALMVAGALILKDPLLVLLGSALSAAAAVLVGRRALADADMRFALARTDLLKAFARYALPLVAANVFYQLIPLLNRGLLAGGHGFAEAGQFSLAADMGARLFMTVGSALDILLFQLAVRAEEREGRASAMDRIGRNLGIVVAVLAPLAVGYWLLLPAFAAVLVPEAYRGPFVAYSGALIPALVAFALILYALNPVFQLAKATGPVVAAALAALALDGALILVLPALLGPLGVAVAQSAALCAALAIMLGVALRRGGLTLPWRDIVFALLACAGMAAVIAPLREQAPPLLAMLTMVTAGGLVYAGFVALFDIAGLRTLALGRLTRRAAVEPAE